MNKQNVYELIEMMNGSESESRRARRKAERLDDPALFPVLKELIMENDHEFELDQRRIRDAAYFIGGKLMKNAYDSDFCEFFISRIPVEKNKYVVTSMLERLAELEAVQIPDIGPVIGCTENEFWKIRHSAITALGAFDSESGRECLRAFAALEDEKKYSNEIVYAVNALGRIGNWEDISLLEDKMNSSLIDVKASAQMAINEIKERL